MGLLLKGGEEGKEREPEAKGEGGAGWKGKEGEEGERGWKERVTSFSPLPALKAGSRSSDW